MAIITEQMARRLSVNQVAEQMMTAARTAPKAKGKDNLEIIMVTEDDLQSLSQKMKEIAVRENVAFFNRDAENILNAEAVVFIGTKIQSMGLSFCGLCGFKNCAEKNQHPNHPCVFNTNDLGIAVGSAVSIAMDNRVDNRVMYTVGMAALELNYFSQEVKIAFGIPLSATSKNPFFDRK